MSYSKSVTIWCPIKAMSPGQLAALYKLRRQSQNDLGEGVVGENNPLHDVFDAIADPTRRRLIQLLSEAQEVPLHELTEQFQMGRTAVSKHLAILKEAGLVQDRKVGRETRYRLHAAPLREILDWAAFYSKFWSTNMMRLNQLLEEEEEE